MIAALNKLFGVLVVLASFIGIHFSSAVASAQGAHSHHQSSNVSCQVLCQCVRPEKKNVNHKKIEEDKDLPFEPFAFLGYQIKLLGKSLGNVIEFWKSSSWRPPDIVLLQGRLGTSL